MECFGKTLANPLHSGVKAIAGGEGGGDGNQGRAFKQRQVTPVEPLNAGLFYRHDVIPILQRVWKTLIPGVAFDGLNR